KKITAFDVSPDGRLYATGHADGSIFITYTGLGSSSSPTTSTKRIGTPHLSTILSLTFFPSSTVLLSTSSDLSLRIHDANLSVSDTTTSHPLNTVRTLQAHTAGVTAAAIVERGRNVLSFSRDATARLWDVGGTKEIVGRRWRAPRGSPVLCGCIGDAWREGSVPGDSGALGTALDGEVGTAGKVIFVGLQNGSVRGYELATGHARFFSSGVDPSLTNFKTAPVDSICYSAEGGALVAGRRDGIVMLWSLNASPRSTANGTAQDDELDWAPTVVFKRNGAGIEGLAFGSAPTPDELPTSPLPSIIIGAEDSSVCHVGLDADGKPVLMEEFIGVEAGDGIRVVKALVVEERNTIWSAGDDGCVRRY
ncbi:hypothetical protein M408DRAFT_80485, partial [Serendipita vermifera MAFF 305830]